MKKEIGIFVIILFIVAGCGEQKQSTNDLIIVDVTKNYPKKELILQDFMDVEYVPLETNDEFVNQGIMLAVGKNLILVRNQVRDGNIFIYDRNGNALRKINHLGQGPEEYSSIGKIILDEENNEIFVNEGSSKKILVYDLFGNFKRSIRHRGDSRLNIYNFNSESLICKDGLFDAGDNSTGEPPFVIISKKDGSILKEIKMSLGWKREGTKTVNHNGMTITTYTSNFPETSVMSYENSWILTVYSTDTMFRYFPDHRMIPFMVRTPSILSQNPESLLYPGVLTEKYYFIQIEKVEPEIRGTNPTDAIAIFPKTSLVYDREEKAIYEPTVYNDDYSNKLTVNMIPNAVNKEIAFTRKIEAYQLIDLYKKGELKNERLKEIASKLDAEDNPVIMLVKHKK